MDSSVPAGACGGPTSSNQSETRRHLGDAADLALAQRPSQLIASEALLKFTADSQGTWATSERLAPTGMGSCEPGLGRGEVRSPGGAAVAPSRPARRSLC